jgi:hypothetical protein
MLTHHDLKMLKRRSGLTRVRWVNLIVLLGQTFERTYDEGLVAPRGEVQR